MIRTTSDAIRPISPRSSRAHGPKTLPNHVRAETKFASQFKVSRAVQTCAKNNHLSSFPNLCILYSVLRPQEGRIAVVTDVGRGMRWTRQRARRVLLSRTAKSCGSGAPRLASSLQIGRAHV